ncbi:hypothetical protein RB594_007835 [Gaeumannomyces avenae]
MSTPGEMNPESYEFQQPIGRPNFVIGQHDSDRRDVLSEKQHSHVLSCGFNFLTAPITNRHFHRRVVDLYHSHIKEVQEHGLSEAEKANPSLPGPILPTLTNADTSLFPSPYSGALVAYSSPWIDLCAEDPVVASLSRQALNLEVAYANFCGARSVIVPGPRNDADSRGVAQYARAIQEAFIVGVRVNLIIHLPMYREPGLEEKEDLLSTTVNGTASKPLSIEAAEIDLFGVWGTWHTVRTVNEYTARLFVALRIPRRLPDKDLQTRWFSEPLHYLTFGPTSFQENRTGNPSFGKHHQDMINIYMRLKNYPWMILYDVGPTAEELTKLTADEFPSLAEAHNGMSSRTSRPERNPQVAYLQHLERQQPPYSTLETPALVSFQDWLQSPLQPLSDNLESSTYEMFEGDPVKYDQYEKAITEAMAEWKMLDKPTSSSDGALVVAVAGAGRGPLVTRVLRASDTTGFPVQLWAVEKNQNAYVYLLRQNEREWGGRVRVVKTDMREWDGPVLPGGAGAVAPGTTAPAVDILVTELLGSFGDNELSPECLDGIQRHLARPHGISIPHSYTAHLSPAAHPRIHADLANRHATGSAGGPDAHVFETPWVVRLFAMDFLAAKGVPGKPRIQEAWEFVHPVRLPFAERWAAQHGPHRRVNRAGGGSMNLAAGLNEHNARHCHLTFVCGGRGAVHGLAGYFESTLYASQVPGKEKDLVEISIHPERIDQKSKDMISWFPIFFPLKQPLYFPEDAELEVSMWRQTDDTKVWYEWMVEAFIWVSPTQRLKVGASEMHSSRKVACLM